MDRISRPVVIRLLPVLLVTVAAMAYIAGTEGPDACARRNTAPLVLLLVLSALSLYRGGGSWIVGRNV